MENVRKTILDEAKNDVCGDRDHQYGSPEDNFDQIARFWSLYLHTDLTSCDVANMMILFKLARNITGEPKLDNWVDIAGYAACGADCQCYLVNKLKKKGCDALYEAYEKGKKYALKENRK